MELNAALLYFHPKEFGFNRYSHPRSFRYLNCEITQQKGQQIFFMNVTNVEDKKYPTEAIVIAFKYFALLHTA